jgi:hypothetical protein
MDEVLRTEEKKELEPRFRSRMPAREATLGGAEEKFQVRRDNGEEGGRFSLAHGNHER